MDNSKLLANGSNAKRIFIVDDDAMTRTIIRTMLEASGFEVIAAGDGEELFRLIESEARPLNIFCIILDVQMPGMNGFDALTRLKIHSDTQNIPVIMLTCQAEPEDLLTGYQHGAEYYIPKPFTREQLLYGITMATGEKL